MQSLLESIRTVKFPTLPTAPEIDDCDWDAPTPEEEREGHELMACLTLDSFAPPTQTFAEFLANQVRLCSIREDHPWFLWLGSRIAELAGRARFLQAQSPDQYDDRDEALSRKESRESRQETDSIRPLSPLSGLLSREASHAAAALDAIRLVSRLIDQPCLQAELRRSVETIERALQPR